MRAHGRTIARTLGVLFVAVAISACGGGADAGTDGTMPTPDANAGVGGGTVADGTATTPTDGTVDGGLGTDGLGTDGLDPSADGLSDATAAVPDLSGDDVSGGLGSAGGSLIAPKAATSESLASADKASGESSSSNTETATKPTTKYSGAKVYLNGTVHSVNEDGSFPKGDPVFRLLSVSAKTIEVELIAGEYVGGGTGQILGLGELVTMVNATEDISYRIKYLRPITATSGVAL